MTCCRAKGFYLLNGVIHFRCVYSYPIKMNNNHCFSIFPKMAKNSTFFGRKIASILLACRGEFVQRRFKKSEKQVSFFLFKQHCGGESVVVFNDKPVKLKIPQWCFNKKKDF